VPIVSELRKLLVRRPIDEAPDAALESIEA
jgi:hypothetical protein